MEKGSLSRNQANPLSPSIRQRHHLQVGQQPGLGELLCAGPAPFLTGSAPGALQPPGRLCPAWDLQGIRAGLRRPEPRGTVSIQEPGRTPLASFRFAHDAPLRPRTFVPQRGSQANVLEVTPKASSHARPLGRRQFPPSLQVPRVSITLNFPRVLGPAESAGIPTPLGSVHYLHFAALLSNAALFCPLSLLCFNKSSPRTFSFH